MIEDGFPTTEPRRSAFDTLPCPPPAPEDDGYLSNVVLAFPGGQTPLPKPTREDLVLSARQWATRVREELFDNQDRFAARKSQKHIRGALDRLDAVLAELAAL